MRPPEADSRTFKAILEYDGSDFSGWQIQPNRRTVQDELEKAVLRITGEKLRVTGAGRTDAGVHAAGQAASFRITKGLPAPVMLNALNAVLPEDVRILSLQEKEPCFDARRDALSRTYRYVIATRPRAIGRRYAWTPRLRYDLEPMRAAGEKVKGKHVWKAFSKSSGQEGEFISTVYDVRWNRFENEIHFEITAERFFHNMIRILLGTLFDVGRGKMTPAQFEALLRSDDRREAGTTLPPHGLFLMRVDYPE
jgi:tRNA pseudouridine38-40 synthase